MSFEEEVLYMLSEQQKALLALQKVVKEMKEEWSKHLSLAEHLVDLEIDSIKDYEEKKDSDM